MDKIDLNTVLMLALGGVVTALLTGKTLRRLLLLPFELLAKKTANKTDDKLVEEARKDLGVPDATHIEEENNKDTK